MIKRKREGEEIERVRERQIDLLAKTQKVMKESPPLTKPHKRNRAGRSACSTRLVEVTAACTVSGVYLSAKWI